jgi:hypothetical protein
MTPITSTNVNSSRLFMDRNYSITTSSQSDENMDVRVREKKKLGKVPMLAGDRAGEDRSPT